MKSFRDLCIVELDGSVAGAYLGKLFADYGATVLLIEPPGGSPLRRDGESWNGMGTTFVFNATSKHSLVLDATVAADRERRDTFIRAADVVIESSSPDPLEPISARLDAPELVRVYISPFGLSGPRAGWRSTPFTDFALSGHMFMTGEPDREPLQGPPRQSEYAAGAQAFYAAMAALWARERIGRGQVVDISLVESLANLHQYTTVMWTHGHRIQGRVGNNQPGPWHPNGHLPCQDGWVSLNSPGRERLTRLLAVMDRLDLLDDPRFADEGDFLAHREEFNAEIAPWLRSHRAQEIADLIQGVRVPAAPLHTMQQVLAYEHLQARGFWRTLENGAAIRMPRGPFTISDHGVELGPPPELGSAGPAVLARFRPDDPADVSSTPVDVGTGPLDGLRILDLTAGWAGPLAGRILADMGADVIRVEAPWARGPRELPAPAVRVTPFFPDDDPGHEPYNRSGIINKHNRNRRDLALRTDTPEGHEVIRRLIATCDAVLENYPPRVMPSLGLAFEQLREINPRIVHVSMPGWGLTGPHAHYVALGPMVEAASGQCMLMGYRDSGPYRQGMAFPDAISGIHGPGALLLALWDTHTDPAHTARHAESAQLEATVMFNGGHLLDVQLTGHEPARLGNRHPRYAPQAAYPCAGDDRWIALSITNDTQWRALVETAECDSAWAEWDEAQRHAQHDTIDEALSAWTSHQDAVALMEQLQALGIPAGAVLDAQGMIEDAHLQARGFWVELEHPSWGKAFPFAALPVHFAETPATYRRAGPTLGEHNREVLIELGYDDAAINGLEAAGVIATQPPA